MIYWNCSTLLGLSYILITSFDFAFCFDSVQFIKLPNHSHGGPKSAARGQSERRASEGLTRTAPNEFFVLFPGLFHITEYTGTFGTIIQLYSFDF